MLQVLKDDQKREQYDQVSYLILIVYLLNKWKMNAFIAHDQVAYNINEWLKTCNNWKRIYSS